MVCFKSSNIYDVYIQLIPFERLGGLCLLEHHHENGACILKASKLKLQSIILVTGIILLQLCCILYIVYIESAKVKSVYEAAVFTCYLVFVSFGIYVSIVLFNTRNIIATVFDYVYQVDAFLTQLHIRHWHIQYLVLGYFTYIFIIISIVIQEIYRYRYLCVDFKVCVCSIICSSIATYIATIWQVIRIGTTNICVIQLVLLNRHIAAEMEKILDEDEMEKILDEDDLDNIASTRLYKKRTPGFNLVMIARIHEKISTIFHLINGANSLILFIFVHGMILLMTMIIFGYIHESKINIELLITTITVYAAYFLTTLPAQLFKYEAQRTVQLMADWNVCYYDPQLIQRRNLILLQTLHHAMEVKLGGVLPLNFNIFIIIAETTITCLLFLAQSEETSNKL